MASSYATLQLRMRSLEKQLEETLAHYQELEGAFLRRHAFLGELDQRAEVLFLKLRDAVQSVERGVGRELVAPDGFPLWYGMED